MSRLYEDQHRALQDRFQSRPMADRIEQIALKTEIGPEDQAFIESRDFFFLTTVDTRAGRPSPTRAAHPVSCASSTRRTSCSPATTATACTCRWATSPPTRTSASCSSTSSARSGCACRARRKCPAPEHLACFKEAELVVRVKITELWMNCPRYIHRYQKLKTSRYVPQADIETPLCEWKRIDRCRTCCVRTSWRRWPRPAPSPSRSGSAASSPATRRRDTQPNDNAAGAVSGGAIRFFAKRLLARYGGVGLLP